MQHCVNITRPSQVNYLKFAIASVDTPSLPYQFNTVENGEFTVNSFYGSIHRQKFCLIAILVVHDGDDLDEALDEVQQNNQPLPIDGEEDKHIDSDCVMSAAESYAYGQFVINNNYMSLQTLHQFHLKKKMSRLNQFSLHQKS
jgi:hypothetical protein